MPRATVSALRDSNLAGKSRVRDERACSHLDRLQETYARLRAPFEEEWTTAQALYLTKWVTGNYNGVSKTRRSTAFVLNERVVPRLVRASVGRGRFFEAQPRTPYEIDKCHANESLLNAQLEEDNFRAKYTPFTREACVIGTGIWKNNWLYDVRKAPVLNRKKEPISIGPEGPVEEETAEYEVEDRVMHHGPHGERADPYSIYCDPTERCPDIIEDGVLTLTQMKSLVRQGVFSKAQVEKVIREDSGRLNTDKSQPAAQRDALLNIDTYHEAFQGERRYQFREGWVGFPIEVTEGDTDTAETVPCLITKIGEFVVQLRRNPYDCQKDPYQFATPIKMEGRRYGLSLTYMNLGMFVDEQDTYNQMSDARTLALIPMLAVPPGSRKRGSYRMHPGKVVEAEKVQQFTYPDVTGTGIVALREMRMSSEDAFGAPSLLDGAPITGESGATGAAIRQQEANVRIQAMAESMEDTFLKPMLSFWHSLNEQFLDETRRVLVLGPLGFEHRVVTPDDVRGQFDFRPLGSSQMIAKSLLAANYQAITPFLWERWMTDPNAVDIDRWLSTILREVFENDHPETIIRTQNPQKRPLTMVEAIRAIALGHIVPQDDRWDYLTMLEEFGNFMYQYGDSLEEDLRNALDEFGAELDAAAKKKALLQQEAQMAAQAQATLAGGEAEGNAAIGPAQRDGQGLTMPRRLMGAMGGGPMGRR